MIVSRDFLPKLKTQEFKDETLSYTGKPDFTPEEPEIRTLGLRGPSSRPRTRESLNRSYT